MSFDQERPPQRDMSPDEMLEGCLPIVGGTATSAAIGFVISKVPDFLYHGSNGDIDLRFLREDIIFYTSTLVSWIVVMANNYTTTMPREQPLK